MLGPRPPRGLRAALNSFRLLGQLPTHRHIHKYIYIYICVCDHISCYILFTYMYIIYFFFTYLYHVPTVPEANPSSKHHTRKLDVFWNDNHMQLRSL